MNVATSGVARADARPRRSSVVLLQTTVPAYREPLLESLEQRFDGRLHVLAGSDYFDPTIRTAEEAPATTLVRNRYLFGRRLLWQRHTLGTAIGAGVVIGELNPRILSTWAALLVRRVLGRPVVLWGHAWSRGGRGSNGDKLRHVMRRLASAVLVYSETEAEDLRRVLPNRRVEVAPNALYPAAAQDTSPGMRAFACDFVFVGRLVESKKPQLLLEAFLDALPELLPETRLVFVGAGPLEADLRASVDERARERVSFVGASTDYERLREIYDQALASVLPGTAGLSLIQSLWFGVPAMIARDERHGPELEAAHEGVNAVFFDSDSSVSLRNALVAVAASADTWRARRHAIARACAARYSVDGMADAFVRVVEAVSR
jgi:glycosyltransferase involved in cell wall biosynthesis